MEQQKTVPLDIVRFLSIENEQLLVSFANNKDELALISHIQGLYEAALMHDEIGVNEMVILQLLVFIHYHFLHSQTCLMRCHLSEAFASARAAMDAGLAAAVIIHDRSKQVEYATRAAPFNGQLNRHLKNLVKDNKPLPHPHVPLLLDIYGKVSTFAGHADVSSFVHRATVDKNDEQQERIFIEYFQYSRNKNERKVHALTLLHQFVMLLDLFADFFVKEQKLLPEAWHTELQTLGGYIEQEAKKYQAALAAETAEK